MIVVRNGSAVPSSMVPCYRYIATTDRYYIVEYCGKLKMLLKDQYSLIAQATGKGK